MQVSGHFSYGFCLSSCETFLFLLLLSLLFWGHFEDMKYLSSLLSLELIQKSETMNRSLWSLTVGERSLLRWIHIPPTCLLLPSQLHNGHTCLEYCTYKHRHALPQMGEHSRPLSRENIWALWLFFYSVHWWKRVIMYSLKRRLSLRGKQLRLTLLSLKCFHGKNPFCFQTIRGNTHLYDCNLCAFFFFVNQHSPSQPFTVIMCSHTKSPAKTPNYFP